MKNIQDNYKFFARKKFEKKRQYQSRSTQGWEQKHRSPVVLAHEFEMMRPLPSPGNSAHD